MECDEGERPEKKVQLRGHLRDACHGTRTNASSSNAYRNQAHLGNRRMIALVPQAELNVLTILLVIRVIVSFFESSLSV
jgi:hypothetical protein